MAILINHTQRAIFFGQTMLVPAHPTEVGNLTTIRKTYPDISDAISAGDIEKLTTKEAAAAVAELEDKTVEEIQEYAKEHGIDLTGKETKEEMLDAVSGV